MVRLAGRSVHSISTAGALCASVLVLAACGGESSGVASVASALAECRRWQTCVPENPCHTGWVTGCRKDQPICTDIGGWLPNGTACGTNLVCDMGECVPCAAGQSCSFPDMYGNPDACQLGAISCSTGEPICTHTGPAPDGTPCGGSGPGGPLVCKGGQCTWCVEGSACAPVDPCHAGTVQSCSTGGTCVDTGAFLQNGSWCGDGRVCRDGACVSCAWWQSCTTGNGCWTGHTDCSSGASVCVQDAPVADGTPCDGGNVCSGGACVPPCVDGQACTPYGNACATGTMSCSSATSGSCNQTGTLVDGTPCGANGETCTGGTCTLQGGHLLVRTASGGLLDLTGTVWTECFWNEPAPGMSRLSSVAYGPGTFTLSDRIFTARLDCTGPDDPAQAFTVSAVATSFGDRVVGWDDAPPAGLPSTVVATAVLLSGIQGPTGLPSQIKTLSFVDDRGNPKWIYEGEHGAAVAPDGYPVNLHASGRPGEGTGPCTPGVPCAVEGGCLAYATQCFSGAPVCAVSAYAPDGTACGPSETCTAGTCGPPPGSALQVRTASGGLVDLSGTTWVACFGNEPAPGQSRKTTDVYFTGGLTHTDETYPWSTDCTGPVGDVWSVTASASAQGDRVVGWGPAAPAGLPEQVTATAFLLTGTDPSTGQPASMKDLRFVDDLASPRVLYAGDDDPGSPTDAWGYPANLSPSRHVEPGACAAGARCVDASNACEIATVRCDGGAPVCTGTGAFAADGTSCGPATACVTGQCLPVATRTIGGTRTITFWPDSGPIGPQAYGNDAGAPVQALVPNVLGGYDAFAGTIGWDGRFEIPGVPAVPYLLVFASGGGTVLVETDASEVDLGFDQLGRAAVWGSASLDLTVNDLYPWSADDLLYAFSSNAPFSMWPLGYPPVAVLPDGSTSAAASVTFRQVPLLDPAQGDVVHVVQDAARTLPDGVPYVSATRYADLPDAALASPGPNAWTADLAAAPAAGAFSSAWPAPACEAHVWAMGPGATAFDHRIAVVAAPHADPLTPGLSVGYLAITGAPLLVARAAPGFAGTSFDAAPFGRFLPSPWTEFRDVRCRGRVVLTASTGDTVTYLPTIVRMEPLAAAPLDADPLVTPPLDLRVNGMPATTELAGVGTGPTISWSPPAVGTPTSYVVRILRMPAASVVATARTAGTSLRLPDGVLASGAVYFAVVQARLAAAERVEAPLRYEFGASFAGAVTAPLRP